MAVTQKIAPCLWFDSQAEQAANYYVSIFESSRITSVSRYPEAGQETHGRPAGSVMTVDFELEGLRFTALNGGPAFQFNEAVSLQVICESQAEVDSLWEKLSAGGDAKSQQCGWLKDKYGLSWQITPRRLLELMQSREPAKAQRAMNAMLRMKKIDIAEIERAVKG